MYALTLIPVLGIFPSNLLLFAFRLTRLQPGLEGACIPATGIPEVVTHTGILGGPPTITSARLLVTAVGEALQAGSGRFFL